MHGKGKSFLTATSDNGSSVLLFSLGNRLPLGLGWTCSLSGNRVAEKNTFFHPAGHAASECGDVNYRGPHI